MNNKTTGYASGGIGFTGLLTILFVSLKLTGHIDWCWFWVLSPILIPSISGAVILLVLLLVKLNLWRKIRNQRKRCNR